MGEVVQRVWEVTLRGTVGEQESEGREVMCSVVLFLFILVFIFILPVLSCPVV